MGNAEDLDFFAPPPQTTDAARPASPVILTSVRDAEPSVVSQITALRHRQDELFATARERRADLLAELGSLCTLLGPLTRDEIPDGVIRRRKAKKGTKPARAQKAKTEKGGA